MLILSVFSCDQQNNQDLTNQDLTNQDLTNQDSNKQTLPPLSASFYACRSCHYVQKDTKKIYRTVGPNLYNIYDKPAGTSHNYNYSPALKNSGVIWNKENLDKFLQNPHKFIPATKMYFSGVNDKKTRQMVIEFLATQSDDSHDDHKDE